MPTIDQNLIDLIDQRIRQSTMRDKATGTCVTRATTGPAADVTFDGSTVAMPVKVLGTVFIRPGDRCILDLYGTEWIVTGSFSSLGFGEAAKTGNGPSGGTGALTSSSYVDLTEITPLRFEKTFDNTVVRISMGVTMRSTSAPYSSRFGLRCTPLDGQTYTPSDYVLNFISFLDTSQRLGSTFSTKVTDMPAGAYSCQVRWRRVSASGSGLLDSGDVYFLEMDERVRTSSPIL